MGRRSWSARDGGRPRRRDARASRSGQLSHAGPRAGGGRGRHRPGTTGAPGDVGRRGPHAPCRRAPSADVADWLGRSDWSARPCREVARIPRGSAVADIRVRLHRGCRAAGPLAPASPAPIRRTGSAPPRRAGHALGIDARSPLGRPPRETDRSTRPSRVTPLVRLSAWRPWRPGHRRFVRVADIAGDRPFAALPAFLLRDDRARAEVDSANSIPTYVANGGRQFVSA